MTTPSPFTETLIIVQDTPVIIFVDWDPLHSSRKPEDRIAFIFCGASKGNAAWWFSASLQKNTSSIAIVEDPRQSIARIAIETTYSAPSGYLYELFADPALPCDLLEYVRSGKSLILTLESQNDSDGEPADESLNSEVTNSRSGIWSLVCPALAVSFSVWLVLWVLSLQIAQPPTQ